MTIFAFFRTFFALFLFAARAHAFCQIVGKIPQTVVVGSTAERNLTVEFECDQNSAGVTQTLQLIDDDGETRTMEIDTSAPRYDFSKDVHRWVPRSGKLFIVENCLVTDVNDFNDSTASIEERFESFSIAHPDNVHVMSVPVERHTNNARIKHGRHKFHRRHRVQVQNRYFRRILGRGHEDEWLESLAPNGFTNQRRLMGFFDDIGDFFSGPFLCAISGQYGCGDNNDVDPEDLEDLEASLQDWVENRLAEVKKENDFDRKIVEVFNETQDILSKMNEYQNITQQSLEIAFDQLKQESEARREMHAKLDGRLGSMSQNVEALGGEVQNVIDVIGSTADVGSANYDSIIALQNATKVNHDSIKSVEELLNENMRLIEIRDIRQSRNIKRIVQKVQHLASDYQMRRSLTRTIHDALQAAEDDPTFEPFLVEKGTPPAESLESINSMLIDNVRVFAIIPELGTPFATEINIVFRCETEFTLRKVAMWSGWRDQLTSIGPPGCEDPDDFDGSGTLCSCWVEVTRKECETNDTLLTSHYTNTFQTQSVLDDASEICVNGDAGIVSQPTVLHTNSTAFLRFLKADLCTEGTYNDPWDQYRVASFMINKQRIRDPRPTICTEATETIIEMTNETTNFIGDIFHYFRIGYTVRQHNFAFYTNKLDGILPRHISKKENPIANIRTKGGRTETGRCMHSGFMAFEHVFEPVQAVRPQTVTSSVTVTIDGTETVVPTTTPILPFPSILPADFVLVGTLSGNSVYDIPAVELSMTEAPSARKGKVTYAWIQNTSDFTIAQWLVENRELPFDHFEATNLPNLYDQPVNSQTELCENERHPGSGSLCTVKSRFTIPQETASTATLVPRTWMYNFRVTIREKDLAYFFASQCPKVTLDPHGASVRVVMSNVGNDPIVVDVVVSEPCFRDERVTIGADQNRDLYLRECVDPETGAPVRTFNVTVFELDDGLNRIACPNSTGVTASINRTHLLEVVGDPDLPEVDIRSVTENDFTILGLADAMYEQQRIMDSITIQISNVVTGLGLSIDPTQAQNLTDTRADLRNISARLEAILENERQSRQRHRNLTNELLQKYEAEWAAKTAEAAAVLAKGDELVKEINERVTVSMPELVTNLSNQQQDLAAVRFRTVESEKMFVEDLIRWGGAVTDAINSPDCGINPVCHLFGGGSFSIDAPWANDVGEFMGDAIKLAPTGGKKVWDGIKDGVDVAEDLAEGVWDGIKDGVDIVEDLGDKILDKVFEIGNMFKNILGKLLNMLIPILIILVAVGVPIYFIMRKRGAPGSAKNEEVQTMKKEIEQLWDEVNALRRKAGMKEVQKPQPEEGKGTKKGGEKEKKGEQEGGRKKKAATQGVHTKKKKKTRRPRKKEPEREREALLDEDAIAVEMARKEEEEEETDGGWKSLDEEKAGGSDAFQHQDEYESDATQDSFDSLTRTPPN